MNRQAPFDVAVVGAGAAGLAAALAFARDGFRTALVGEPGHTADGRTVALLEGSVQFLRSLGVWPRLVEAAAPLAVLRIVDDTGSLFRPPPVSFAAGEIGLQAFGWNVENTALIRVLWEVAQQRADIAFIPGRALGFGEGADRARVTSDAGEPVDARLVVAADGRQSRLRESGGLEARRWSYPQSALTVILAHDREHGDASTEFHTREGPFTLVPLPGRRSSLVWVTRPARAAELAALDDARLGLAIERQAHSLLGAMRVDGPRGVVPLSGLSVRRYAAPRLVLVGEAAHVFPPIGAQGLNLGFRDVAALRDAVVHSRERGLDPGGDAALQRYQRSRELDVPLRRAAVDGLNRSLLSDLLPLDLARGAGLLLMSSFGPLRRAVMREGVLPRFGAPSLMRAPPPMA